MHRLVAVAGVVVASVFIGVGEAAAQLPVAPPSGGGEPPPAAAEITVHSDRGRESCSC